jgi:uncharacterized protein YndB with AHSA1/START domain
MSTEQAVWGEIEITAPAEAVYAALTDERQLMRWFSEYADISLADRRYEFWGRFTPDGAERDGQRIANVEVTPFERLSYTWSLFDCDTQVQLTLREVDGGTRVIVDHTGLAFDTPWLLEMFWSMALENLRAWVERGAIGYRGDYGERRYGDIHVDLELDAPQETVFSALIEPEQLQRYMSESPSVDAVVGGRYDLGWGDDGPLEILMLDAPRTLRYSWASIDDGVQTVVTWNLSGSGGKTRLTLVHSGFGAERDTTGFTNGWLDFLNRIRFMSEGGATWRKPDIALVAPAERDRRAALAYRASGAALDHAVPAIAQATSGGR